MRMPNAANRGLTPAQLARRAGVTIKTLRHYEDRGLLTPDRSPSGWRVFDSGQLERLDRIRAFRRMGFELAQIADLLDATPEVLADTLAKQADLLERRMDELNDTLETVREAQRKAGGDQEVDKSAKDSEPVEKSEGACVRLMQAEAARRIGGRGAASEPGWLQRRWPPARRRAA